MTTPLRPRRLMAVSVLVAMTLAACAGDGGDGGDGGGPSTGATSPNPSGTSTTGGGGSDIGENGSVEFDLSGGLERNGGWSLVPEASVFNGSTWHLTYTDKTQNEAVLLNIELNPEFRSLIYADTEVSVSGFGDECTYDIGDQTASGVSGTIECLGLSSTNIDGTAGPDGIDFRVTFDAHP